MSHLRQYATPIIIGHDRTFTGAIEHKHKYTHTLYHRIKQICRKRIIISTYTTPCISNSAQETNDLCVSVSAVAND